MVLSTSRMASKKGLINSAFIGGPCAISRPVYRLHETKIQLFRLRTGNEFSPCSRGRIAVLPLENPPSPCQGGTVAQPLLELGNTPFGTTRPDRRAVHAHLEYAARTRHLRHLAQLLGER